jgi:hypothetical protein
LDRVKEVKVKIPVSYHIKLHSMKVLTGKQISDAVTEALEVYFAAKRIEMDPSGIVQDFDPATIE